MLTLPWIAVLLMFLSQIGTQSNDNLMQPTKASSPSPGQQVTAKDSPTGSAMPINSGSGTGTEIITQT